MWSWRTSKAPASVTTVISSGSSPATSSRYSPSHRNIGPHPSAAARKTVGSGRSAPIIASTDMPSCYVMLCYVMLQSSRALTCRPEIPEPRYGGTLCYVTCGVMLCDGTLCYVTCDAMLCYANATLCYCLWVCGGSIGECRQCYIMSC